MNHESTFVVARLLFTSVLQSSELGFCSRWLGLRVLRCCLKFGTCLDPPDVPLLRALLSLLDGIWGILKGSWGGAGGFQRLA